MPAATTAALVCLILYVSDGDSVTARCRSEQGSAWQTPIRIADIDAPELHQAFGMASRTQLAQLCLHREALVTPQAHDIYGRMVARLQCGEQDAAAAQLQSGMAWLYTRDTARKAALVPLEAGARHERAGLWSQKRPMAPWNYRKRYGAHGSSGQPRADSAAAQ
ncbi:thermonuclease family protein [Diaphorobacter ruginosibacter]|uniref:thermonuclease family protein n=1 Tax=Diaphorobacter ruginosibacter TaxID=1715720 RepID=UPI0033428D2F